MKRFFFFSPDDSGGEVVQAAEKVEEAAEDLQKAAIETPSAAKAESFDALHGVLTGIHSELKRFNDRAETSGHAAVDTAEAVTELPAAVAEEAEAEVEAPPPPKKVRRGFRKVTKK